MRPRYGGTLRVQIRAHLASLDPREWPADPTDAAAAEKLAGLVCECLVRLDENSRPQPSLAVSWYHDAAGKRWEFRLRPGVKFHDRTALTPAVAAAGLEAMGGGRRVSASGESVVIEADLAMPNLLPELAQSRNCIYWRAADGALLGTGPFRIAEWEPGRRALLAANESHWEGRPFLDTVEIQMGRSPREQWLALELDQTDVAEIEPNELRPASRAGLKTRSTAPLELVALVFPRGRPVVEDARMRQALALSIDREAMQNVLLQKQGELAGGLLPQWLSGYAFLFRRAADVPRSRAMAREAGSSARPLALTYDSADALAKALAERIAVNARDAGIAIQVPGQRAASATTNADARVARRRLVSPEPGLALAELAAAFELADRLRLTAAPTPEDLFAAERGILESFRVVPLFYLPEVVALSPRVKDWAPSRWGRWRLESVWLDSLATLPTISRGGVEPGLGSERKP